MTRDKKVEKRLRSSVQREMKKNLDSGKKLTEMADQLEKAADIIDQYSSVINNLIIGVRISYVEGFLAALDPPEDEMDCAIESAKGLWEGSEVKSKIEAMFTPPEE